MGGFSWPRLYGTSRSNAVGLAARGHLAPRSHWSRRPAHFNLPIGWRNINRLPIGYALGPRLRTRLTLGGLTFPRKPCAFGGRASHPSCRYSFRHTHSTTLHGSLRCRFAADVDALLPTQWSVFRIRFSASEESTARSLLRFAEHGTLNTDH